MRSSRVPWNLHSAFEGVNSETDAKACDASHVQSITVQISDHLADVCASLINDHPVAECR